MELSNKTIFGLLSIIILLSLVSAFISLNKLSQIQAITGLQANVTTEQGTTQVVVLGAAQITLHNRTMDFGSGQVNGSYSAGHDFCSLQTNATISSAGNDFTGSSLGQGGKSPACVDVPSQGLYIPWSFVIENTGNNIFTNVTIAAGGGAAAFKSNFSSSVANGSWYYRFDEEGSNACTENVNAAYTEVPASATIVCSSFQFAGDDAFLIQMNVSLPEDAAAKNWSDTVTFTGSV